MAFSPTIHARRQIASKHKSDNFFYTFPSKEFQKHSASMALDCYDVLVLFEEAIRNKEVELVIETLSYICRNGSTVLAMNDFGNLPAICVASILGQNRLLITSETEVFLALYNWGKRECERQNWNKTDSPQIRIAVDNLIKFVRFPTMSHSDFCKCTTSKKNLLSPEEIESVLNYFNAQAWQLYSAPTVGEFSCRRRFTVAEVSAMGQRTCEPMLKM